MRWNPGKKKSKRKLKEEHTTFEIEGMELPVIIYREWRRNVRTSIGKKAILLRLPSQLTAEQDAQQIEQSKDWLVQKIRNNPSLVSHYFFKKYRDGDVLQVGNRSYQLQITEVDNKRNSASMPTPGVIRIRLSQGIKGDARWRDVQSLLSRVVAADFMPEIQERVHELNRQHFRKPINGIKLKHNFSNSGSCSTKGNINLSTRLLFAPDKVIDYVIIHELAHLIEMNHSPRFWKLVEKAMPEYRECERWLKKYSRKMGF